MKIVLDVPAQKMPFMLELLSNLPFVKARPVAVDASDDKAVFLAEFSEAVDELNDVLANRKEARDAYGLLDEL